MTSVVRGTRIQSREREIFSWWTRLTAALLLMVDRCRLRECNDDRGRCNNIEIDLVAPGGGGGSGCVSGSWPAE